MAQAMVSDMLREMAQASGAVLDWQRDGSVNVTLDGELVGVGDDDWDAQDILTEALDDRANRALREARSVSARAADAADEFAMYRGRPVPSWYDEHRYVGI